MDLSDWPSPFPRLAAYTRMFKSKMIEKLTADGLSPDRANEEAPLFQRYWTFFWSSEPSEILPGLLLGSVKNAADYAGLVRNGVATVVNATVAMDHFFESKFEYVRVPMEDTKDAAVPETEFRRGVAAVAACVQAGRLSSSTASWAPAARWPSSLPTCAGTRAWPSTRRTLSSGSAAPARR